MQSAQYSFLILMKLSFSRQNFEKASNIKFHENPSSESRVVPCRRTDGQTGMTKLIVTFRNYTTVLKKTSASKLGSVIWCKLIQISENIQN
jgi:hypothetical protein